MRKVFIAIMVLMSITCAGQVIRNGKTFTKVSNKSIVKSDTIVTDYTWQVKDTLYPIIVSKSGSCFIGKISSKTGKYYRSYLPKEVSAEISKELGIEYKPKK
jgi:hypothetical protein